MYLVTRSSFGRHVSYVLRNERTGEYLSVVPAFGAVVHALGLRGAGTVVPVIVGEPTPAALKRNRWFRGVKLLPFPNRLANAQYTFDGVVRHVPKNLPGEPHAIHGLVYNKPFSVVRATASVRSATLELQHLLKPTKAYPFTLRIRITYTLSARGMRCSTVVKNVGASLAPFGDGWHPYFALTAPVHKLAVRLPAAKRVALDAAMIPTGKLHSDTRFVTSRTIGALKLDTGFALVRTRGVARTELHDGVNKLALTLWQDASAYPCVQLFIPPDRQSIAIEPMSCPANAFNSGRDLRLLRPGKTFVGTYGVSLRLTRS
jgi:aldose 1-epimerase